MKSKFTAVLMGVTLLATAGQAQQLMFDIADDLGNYGVVSGTAALTLDTAPGTYVIGNLLTLTVDGEPLAGDGLIGAPNGVANPVDAPTVTADVGSLGAATLGGIPVVFGSIGGALPELLVLAGNNGAYARIGLTGGITEGTMTLTIVPEPHEYAMLAGLGLLSFGAYRRFRKA